LNFVIGRSLPEWIGGRIFFAAYRGNKCLGPVRYGFMVAADYSFGGATHCDGRQYHKWKIVADYASGRNAIGGAGIGIRHYFTPDIYLLTGPVWFKDIDYNGRWKWSVQVFINV
jgi:hypothetical protein